MRQRIENLESELAEREENLMAAQVSCMTLETSNTALQQALADARRLKAQLEAALFEGLPARGRGPHSRMAAPASSPQQRRREPAAPVVSAEVRLRPRTKPSKGGRWSLGALLREAARQLLPEPAPVRTYRHPSQYTVDNGDVYYSDGMPADYEPTLFTKVFAAATLGAYIGVPQIILSLAALSFWFWWARIALAALMATCYLPLRPLFWRRAASSFVFLCWRRYFHFSYVFDQSLDAYNDYVIAQFPHGAFPLGSLVCGTFMATEFPEYTCYALAANSSFLVPVWRHVHTWLGTMAATEKNFRRLLALGTRKGLRSAAATAAAAAGQPPPQHSDGGASSCAGSAECSDAGTPPASAADAGGADSQALLAAAAAARSGLELPPGAVAGEGAATQRATRLRKRNPQGVSIGVMVGGIAEMYLLHPDYECIKLLDRKGFVRVAIEHGADILPVYMLGASRMTSFGPTWLADAARKLRMSIGVLYGAWGTPVPRRVPLRMAVGVPVSVGPALQRSDPGFEGRVERVHAAVVEAIRHVYYKHRGAYGWGDRELVIV
ncbi:diacylglycerol acyltransferase [Raphidocelis subcapitata]|uniref:Diacylglycerol acyltransferase n=1 Tax=Raphidocelis subcapitata TaxID=307507 RepID=A0A2V0PMF4_9CHLO|nr:diacylglycerol acyltransferase [Raphidocelis subcapitata]|eukprot:GBF98537.1 diacylglycerol acyltransferase [Raphidocelis subcapitata]